MSDARGESDAGVSRRSFLGGAAATLAGVALTPATAACQQPKPLAGAGASGAAAEVDAFIKGLAAEGKSTTSSASTFPTTRATWRAESQSTTF